MSLREEMPATAAAIDQLREVFGVELVNAAIRRTMRGEPHGLYAVESGKTFGMKHEPRGVWVSVMDIRPVLKREEDARRSCR